jgi:hypothetical protein
MYGQTQNDDTDTRLQITYLNSVVMPDDESSNADEDTDEEEDGDDGDNSEGVGANDA